MFVPRADSLDDARTRMSTTGVEAVLYIFRGIDGLAKKGKTSVMCRDNDVAQKVLQKLPRSSKISGRWRDFIIVTTFCGVNEAERRLERN